MLFSVGPLSFPPEITSVKCAEPQHSILDFRTWLTLQEIKQDLNAHKDFENYLVEEIHMENHSLTIQQIFTISRNLEFLT